MSKVRLSRLLAAVGFLWCSTSLMAAVPEAEAFDAHFRQVLVESGVPGGAYAVVVGGAVARVQGHGRRSVSAAAPVDADTVFRLASVSKTFAAVATGLTVRDGQLGWQDSLADRLPGFALKRAEDTRRLRIEDLLGQSTGLVPNAYDNLLDADQLLANILPHFRELTPICAPRSCYSYQNIAFSLIDPVLEQASGEPYTALVQRRLFTPLGMRRASFGLDALQADSNHALPHEKRAGVWRQAVLKPAYYQVAPAAGINASARDLGQWLLAQLGHFPAALPAEVITAATRKRVRTPRELRRRGWSELLDDAHYGLGWRIYRIGDDELYLHSGWVKGYVAEVAYSPRHGVGLAVVLNAESSALNRITTAFWAQVFERPVPVIR